MKILMINFLSFMSNSIVDGLFITFGSLAILLDIYHRTVIMTALGVILIGLGLFGAQLIALNLHNIREVTLFPRDRTRVTP